ncbi:MAG: O-acetyl-ADP-ribose deacetylase [Dysgonomonas sp.]|nr:O-acetyl-ADP-ribose deacetylase [Dysgonomonas sp.]
MKINNTEIELILGDITTIQVDVIVNAANSSLLGGGGVDGAIHRKGGNEILDECKLIRNRQGGCKTGEAVYTKAGKLPAKYVIHTVGPVWNGGKNNEPQLLADCYRKSMLLANKLEVQTIAFPNISTGIYGYPKKEASVIALDTIKDFLEKENRTINKVIFVCFDKENYTLYKDLVE